MQCHIDAYTDVKHVTKIDYKTKLFKALVVSSIKANLQAFFLIFIFNYFICNGGTLGRQAHLVKTL